MTRFNMEKVAEMKKALKALQIIPGIGKSMANDLWKLGIKKVEDLKGQNPTILYERLKEMAGGSMDPCVLYTFRCAVYFATETHHDPEKLNWWWWKGKNGIGE